MKKPLVSIILSTYNWKTKWLSESIESVLNQTYRNFEFIIINDCSTNNVEKIILDYKEKDKRIIYIKNKRNLKLTKSLNKWLELSQWEYIARIDDDDIWCNKEKLQKQVEFMEKNTDYWLCWTSTIIIDKKWKIISKSLMRESNKEIKNNLLKSNQFTHSSILLKKSILNKIWWLYNPKYNWAEDYELWLRIWRISRLYNIPEYLVKYRWLETSISRKKWLEQEYLALKVMIKNKKYYPYFYKSLILRLSTLIIPKKIKKYILSKIKIIK